MLVDNPEALRQLCARIGTVDWIALDTEFMREKTYYPQLCLIQVAAEDVLACIDPLAVDISPLLDAIYSDTLLKVIHAARQDLEVLCDLRNTPPQPIFDTQVAAALLGHEPQIGYGPLVEVLTGAQLQKAYTRTDWQVRPLTPEQLHYAEDDVRYLRQIFPVLSHKLEEAGRGEWLREDCAALCDVSLYRVEPEHAYRRLAAGHQLTLPAQQVLRELAAWRERTAQSRNLPRTWIADDASLMAIARRSPETAEDLNRIPGVPRGFIRHAEDVLKAVATARAAPVEPVWPAVKPPDANDRAACKKAAAFVAQTAAGLGLTPSVLASRRDIQDLVIYTRGPLTQGWRWRVVGEQLLAMQRDSARTSLRSP